MKVLLMHPDRDFHPAPDVSGPQTALLQDLEVEILLQAMAQGDEFLYRVAKGTMLDSLAETAAILFRQDILRDCLAQADVVRKLYDLPLQAAANKQRQWLGIFSRYPSGIVSGGRQMLEMHFELFARMRALATENRSKFQSAGFRRFFSMLERELSAEYIERVNRNLGLLRFRRGVVLSAELGQANKGTHYVLRARSQDGGFLDQLMGRSSKGYSFNIHPRDDAGARALGDLRDRGLNAVADAVGQAADHVEGFFQALRLELAFYVGCLNLAEALSALGEPICFPEPAPARERDLSASGLYDPTLALTMGQRIVENSLTAKGREMIFVTGANQGGKTTFLRSVGLSQLMMQCGMFVPAETLRANTCSGVFTHFKREEDATLESGKLDEELARLSGIIDALSPNALLLFNESFSSTNQAEGAELARQVTSALLERQIKVIHVTHLQGLAEAYSGALPTTLFLRAERTRRGKRTFKILPGEPLETSFGQDVYARVFPGDGLEMQAGETALRRQARHIS
jgi:MutS domain V